MTVRFSTGLRNSLLNTTGLSEAMADGTLDIYSGTQPASADAVPNGTKLVEIKCTAKIVTGGGVYLEGAAAAGGVVAKFAADLWQGTADNSGTAGWFRYRQAGDTGTASSTTLKRIDGSIATSGGDMNTGSLTITAGAPNTISTFSVTLPA